MKHTFCIYIAWSGRIQILKIAFLDSSVLKEVTWFFPLFLVWFALNLILIITLIIWFIKLIVLLSLHSIALYFFGIVIKIELLRSSGISPLLYILFIISVIISIQKLSFSISDTIAPSSSRLLLFILTSTDLTTDLSLHVLQCFLCITCLSPFVVKEFSSVFVLFWSIFTFSVISLSFLNFIHPI